jgi:hypothetical protein
MCWRVGNAFLLSATVDDIGNDMVRIGFDARESVAVGSRE